MYSIHPFIHAVSIQALFPLFSGSISSSSICYYVLFWGILICYSTIHPSIHPFSSISFSCTLPSFFTSIHNCILRQLNQFIHPPILVLRHQFTIYPSLFRFQQFIIHPQFHPFRFCQFVIHPFILFSSISFSSLHPFTHHPIYLCSY